MKNSNEMVNSLLERREHYVAEQKKKRTIIIRTGISICCVCIVALLGIGVWQGGIFKDTSSKFVKNNGKEYMKEDEQDDGILAEGNEVNKNDTLCGEYWVSDEVNSESISSINECTTVASEESTAYEPINKDDICDILGVVVIDGVTYMQFETNSDAYTPDTYLGVASEYEGTYKTHLNEVEGKVFTTKEDSDILIVKLTNAGTVILRKEK